MNKSASLILTVALVISIGIIFYGRTEDGTRSAGDGPVLNVEVRDGIQYVTVRARGGYAPRVSTARAGIPTKLVMETNGTYDCSSALVIASIGYRSMLAPTGEEVIDLGTPQAGTLDGTCSMGMYHFAINFE